MAAACDGTGIFSGNAQRCEASWRHAQRPISIQHSTDCRNLNRGNFNRNINTNVNRNVNIDVDNNWNHDCCGGCDVWYQPGTQVTYVVVDAPG